MICITKVDRQLRTIDKLPATLRMCYYTGLNTADLIRGRLFFTLKSQLLQDDEFQEFVRHDIKIAVNRKQELTPVIVAAYRSAPPFGKNLSKIRSASRPRYADVAAIGVTKSAISDATN